MVKDLFEQRFFKALEEIATISNLYIMWQIFRLEGHAEKI